MQLIRFLIIILLSTLTPIVYLQSQQYTKLTFREFLENYTIDSSKFKKVFNENIIYPNICWENNIEGEIEYYLFYHGNGEYEVVVRDKLVIPPYNLPTNLFLKNIEDAVNKNKKFFQNKHDQKYFTSFKVKFDIEPFDSITKINDNFLVQKPKMTYTTKNSH